MKPFVKDIICIIISLVVIISIICNTFSSCMLCSWKEGLSNIYSYIDEIKEVDKQIERNTKNVNYCNNEITDYVWSTPDHDANISTLIQPDTSLVYYSDTEKRPDCCGNTCGVKQKQIDRVGISKTSGCPCHSNEQIRYLRLRGGNANSFQCNIGDEDNIIT